MSAALDHAPVDQSPIFADARADPVAEARALAPLLRDEAPKIEALGRLTETVVDALHARGLYRALLPRHLNGYAAGIETFVKLMEVLAAADASTAWCVGQASGCSMAAGYVEPAIARQIWGDDPRGVLAWGFQIEGRAKVVPGGYRSAANGAFGSGGHHATWMGAHCHVELPDGTLLKGSDGNPIERTMLLRQEPAELDQHLGRGRAARHRQRHLYADRRVRPGGVTRCGATSTRSAGSMIRSSSSPPPAPIRAVSRRVSMGIARGMLDALKSSAQSQEAVAHGRARCGTVR